MKLNIKTIKGETFVIEAEKKDTVGGVKQKIFEAKAVEVATQKLIFKGMQLVDEKTLEECGVADGDMMVMMSVKKVANAQPVPVEIQPQPVSIVQQPVQGPANQGGLGVNVLSQEQFNKTVDDIVTMGFSRQEAIVALQAAYNNPDRAIDYLLNGMPQNTNQAMFGAEEFDEDSDSGSPELNFGGAGAGGAGVGGMPNSQMLSQLRAAIQQDPSVLQQILSQLATTNPQLYQLIQQHPSEFMNLLNSAEDSGNAGGEEGDDLADDDYDEVEVPAITANDNAAIERLCGLGFERAQALEAFVACEKDENMAANYLLEWSLRGENPPGQNNQNAPSGGNNSNPGQN